MKKAKKYGIIAGTLALSAFLCACGEPNTSTQDIEQPAVTGQVQQDEIIIDMQSGEKELLLADGKTLGLIYQCRYPVVTIPENEEASQKINDYVKIDLDEWADSDLSESPDFGELAEEDKKITLLDMAQNHFDSMAEFGEGTFHPYFEEQEYEVKTKNHQMISFAVRFASYSGGAHGYNGYFGETFNTQTGEKLTLKDIAVHEEEFKNFCIDEIMSLSKEDKYKYEGQSIFFEFYEEQVPELMNDDSWYFAEDGLTFTANPYHLAPYAAGVLDFVIPYEDLKGIVQPQYLPDK